MASKPIPPGPSPATPVTYDDIVRRTVPNPDGSFRPSREQVADAYRAPAERAAHLMSADEQQLYARVIDTLLGDPTLIAGGVRVDVEGSRVILSGGVDGPTRVRRTEELVTAIPGVTGVDNHLSPVPPARS